MARVCILVACLLAIGASSDVLTADRARYVDPAIAAAIRRLDCSRVSADDVRTVLAHAPAPRIVLLQEKCG